MPKEVCNTVKVIQINRPGDLVIADRPSLEAPAPGEAVVRIKAAGICGSDVHIFYGKNPFAVYPRIIGHEAAGEVVCVGQGATHVKPGDHVAIDNVFACGKCYACRIGRPNVCSGVKVLGVHIDGVFCEYVKVPADHLYIVPSDIPWEWAATIEPYSIAAEAMDRGKVTSEDSVLICGAGPTGLVILQACKMIGARVLIMDVVDSRLERAKAMGADATVNTRTEDLTRAVMLFTRNEGVNVAMEATGVVHVLEQLVAGLVSSAGRIVVLGFPVEPAKLSPADIMKRELDIKGSRLNNRKFGEVIAWFAERKVDPSSLISHVLPFEAVAKGMELFTHHPAEVCKILLKFD